MALFWKKLAQRYIFETELMLVTFKSPVRFTQKHFQMELREIDEFRELQKGLFNEKLADLLQEIYCCQGEEIFSSSLVIRSFSSHGHVLFGKGPSLSVLLFYACIRFAHN